MGRFNKRILVEAMIFFALFMVFGESPEASGQDKPNSSVTSVDISGSLSSAAGSLNLSQLGQPKLIVACANPSASSNIDNEYNYAVGKGIDFGPRTSGFDFDLGSGNCYRPFAYGAIYYNPEYGAREIHGDISDAYIRIGGLSFFGFPKTDVSPTKDGIGRYSVFEGGNIYWNPNTGAWSVHGAILQKYLALNGGYAGLQNPPVAGYPTSDEKAASDNWGRMNTFQDGIIFFGWNTGPYWVHGAILQRYLQLGEVRSYLGYPKSDEMPDGQSTRVSQFANGWIAWNGWAGAVPTPYPGSPNRIYNGVYWGEDPPALPDMKQMIWMDPVLPPYRKTAATTALYEVSLGLCGAAAHARYNHGFSGAWCTKFVAYAYRHTDPTLYPEIPMDNICASRWVGIWLIPCCMDTPPYNSAFMEELWRKNGGGYYDWVNWADTVLVAQPGDYLTTGEHSRMIVAKSFDKRFVYIAEGNAGDCVNYTRLDASNDAVVNNGLHWVGVLNPAWYSIGVKQSP